MGTEVKATEGKAEIIVVDPKTVKVGWRARKDDGDISELAESIQRIGQLHPITVRIGPDDSPIIIAGLRRLRACRKLGLMVKAVVIKPEDELATLTVQLEENIKRKNFDRLEVGEGLKRYKMLYEKKHGLEKGWNLKRAMRDEAGQVKKDAPRPAGNLVQATSRSLGVSPATVWDLLGIADLPDEDKKEIAKAKTTRERNVAASKALSKVRKERKLKKLEVEATKKEKARIKAKPAPVKGKKEPPAPEQRIFAVEADYHRVLKQPPTPLKDTVDLILTDPPYDLERNPILHTERATINDQALARWDRLDIGWVLDVAPLLADKGSLIAFTPLELVGLYKVVCQRAKLTYRGCIVWHKTNPAPAHRSVYAPSCEAIVWATKGDKYTFRPWDNAGTADAHNLITSPVCGGNERLAHPAQKPLAVVQRLIERHTDKASLVFDPFMGTGTTLVACAKLGLRAVGAEMDAKYFKMARTRLAAL